MLYNNIIAHNHQAHNGINFFLHLYISTSTIQATCFTTGTATEKTTLTILCR